MRDGYIPEDEARTVGAGEIRYLRSTGHGHEGAHLVDLCGRYTVVVYPDSRTSARRRQGIIRDALERIDLLELDPVDSLRFLIGRLVLEGLVDIEVDGAAIVDEAVAAWKVELTARGEVRVTHLGKGTA